MENVLKANLDILKDVSAMISRETGCNIIICDHEGEIIEATLRERIGKRHAGSKMIIAGTSDEAIITPELEEQSRDDGTDTRVGYNYVIQVGGKKIGSLGVAGESHFLKPIVRIAANTIGFYISEYLKEKEKNNILQKMASIAEEIAQKPFEEIDYQIFANDLLDISGAKVVFFDSYDAEGEISTIVGVAGGDSDIKKLTDFMGFEILGCQRHNRILNKLKNSGIAVFESIAEFPCNLVPKEQCHLFQSVLDIGQVCSLEIAHQGKMIGDFILFMPHHQNIQNAILVELYAAQVGQLLMRAKAEVALKKSEANLKRALNILDSFWEHSPNPICILDMNGNIIRISQSASQLFEKTPQELEGRNIADAVEPTLVALLTERLNGLKESKEPVCFSDNVTLLNGEYRHYDSWVFPVVNGETELASLGIVALDVTDRKQNEERLRYLSHHDSLTGIHNRTFFEKEIKRLARSNEYPITILSLDADGLKIINDTMGHERGDEFLKNLALILKNSLRESDILARMGGDEFVIILPRTGYDTAQTIAARIKKNVMLHNQQNPSLPVSVSLGLCSVDEPGNCLEDILKKADERMYHNKLSQKESSKSQIINALMVALSERDYVTQGHTKRLLAWCLQVGERVKLSHEALTALALLSQVHDLGKVGIPDKILLKPGPLAVEEWELMRQHSEKGYRIAAASSSEMKGIADLILKHHERWDGKGYPLGLKEQEIPMACRILAVADSYDAMTNERPYSNAKTQEEAIAELKRCSGSQFDPEIVQMFIEVLDLETVDNRIS